MYDFPTAEVQNISHKGMTQLWLANHKGTRYVMYRAKPGYDFQAPWVPQCASGLWDLTPV
jgi:hypothetical protein